MIKNARKRFGDIMHYTELITHNNFHQKIYIKLTFMIKKI